jgi:geranylgeranyl diphosphate synthase type II
MSVNRTWAIHARYEAVQISEVWTETNMDIAAYLHKQTERIDEALSRCLDGMGIPDILREAMLYSLTAGGKRLRPILLLAAAEAVCGRDDDALPAACAVEMIHTYSLIHDDLPAMDNDDYRRGKPTNHKVYGEAMAILAGDGLLTHAFRWIADPRHAGNVPADIRLRVCAELALYAGPAGMVGGQAADIMGDADGIEALEAIHRRKTGDLIVFCLRAGGLIGGADERRIAALDEFGRKLGLAFQIQDDILDQIGDERKLGKKAGRDVKQDKLTYASALGLERCRELVVRLSGEAKAALRGADLLCADKLHGLADYMMNRDH